MNHQLAETCLMTRVFVQVLIYEGLGDSEDSKQYWESWNLEVIKEIKFKEVVSKARLEEMKLRAR